MRLMFMLCNNCLDTAMTSPTNVWLCEHWRCHCIFLEAFDE